MVAGVFVQKNKRSSSCFVFPVREKRAAVLPRVDGQFRRDGVCGVHAYGGLGVPELLQDVPRGERHVLLVEGPRAHDVHRLQLAQSRRESAPRTVVQQ